MAKSAQGRQFFSSRKLLNNKNKNENKTKKKKKNLKLD